MLGLAIGSTAPGRPRCRLYGTGPASRSRPSGTEQACRSLGSHGFCKVYTALREQGIDDEAVRLQLAWHLGHNRVRVTVQSYVAAQRESD